MRETNKKLIERVKADPRMSAIGELIVPIYKTDLARLLALAEQGERLRHAGRRLLATLEGTKFPKPWQSGSPLADFESALAGAGHHESRI